MAQSHHQHFDRWIISISGITFLACVVLLTNSQLFSPLGPPVKNTEIIAEVSRSENDVRRRKEEELNWLDLRNLESVFQADSVFTGEHADAEITFNNGSKISLDPNTLVKISSEFGQTKLDLKVGGLTWILGEKPSSMSVKNGSKVSQIKGDHAKVRITHQESGEKQITVLAGDAEINIEDSKAKLSQNQQVQITQNGKIEAVKTFTLTLVSPSSDAALWSKSSGILEFKWNPHAELKQYRILLSSSEDFNHPLQTHELSDSLIELKNLPDRGVFFWKVIGFDAPGSSVRAESPTFKFTLIPEAAPLPTNPSLDTHFKVQQSDRENVAISKKAIELTWTDPVGAEKFEIQISSDESFSPLLFSKTIDDLKITTPELETGHYFWRIRAIDKRNPQLPWSKSSSFSIDEQFLEQKPTIISTQDSSRQVILNENAKAHVQWQAVSGAKHYRIQVATDSSFSPTSIRVSKTTESPSLDLTLSSPATYYWRVRAIDEHNWTSDYSKPEKLELIKKAPLPAPAVPSKQNEFELHSLIEKFINLFFSTANADETEIGPKLKWAAIPGAAAYHLEISESPEFTQILFKTDVKLNHVFWNAPGPGTYYWRVAAVDPEGDLGQMSEVVKLKVSVAPSSSKTPETIIEKFSSREDFNKYPAEVDLIWTPVKFAKYYRIQFGENKHFNQPETKETKKTHLTVQLKKEGTFYWRIQALNSDQQTIGSYSKTIPLHYSRNFIPIAQKMAEAKKIVDTKTIAKSQYQRNPGLQCLLGISSLSYQETRSSNFSSIILTGRFQYEKEFSNPKWMTVSHARLSLLPLTSSPSGTNMRIFGLDTNLSYTPSWLSSPWELDFQGGIFYQTTFVPNNSFGYHGMHGPQFIASLRRSLKQIDSLQSNLRTSFSGQNGPLPAGNNSEVALGVSWFHQRDKGQLPIVLAIDFEKTNLEFSELLLMQSNTLTLSAGTLW